MAAMRLNMERCRYHSVCLNHLCDATFLGRFDDDCSVFVVSGWFPTSGMENVAAFYEGWDRVVDIAHHLVLPTITLSLFYLALIRG